jgi:hypothetical protein
VQVRWPECATVSHLADPGATGWDCPCGYSYGLRRCSSCQSITPVSSVHKRGRPWTCAWCQAANDGYARKGDPATVTVADLAGDMDRHGLESVWAPPAGGDPRPAAQGAVVDFRRTALRLWLILLLSGGPGLICLGGVASYTTHGWEKVFSAVGLLACAIWGIRIAMTGIFAGPEQVIVRNYFRTYRVGWAEITGFDPPRYLARRQNGLGICLTDGAMIRATLYARGAGDSGTAASKAIQELERLRSQRALTARS